jgi:hypothetical protein
MKKITFLSILVLLILFTGCGRDVSEEDFFKDATFDTKLIDVEFRDSESHEAFVSTYDDSDFDVVSFSTLEGAINNHEHYRPSEELDLPFGQKNGTYVLIPIYHNWLIDDVNVEYGYESGRLIIRVSEDISNFPMSSINLFVVSIESSYAFEVDVQRS